MQKVSTKKKSVKESVDKKTQEDDLEGEIIDLVDPADDYLETIEAHVDLSSIATTDLDDPLDKELMGIDVRGRKGPPINQNQTHQGLEEALVQLFESSESAAAKLIEKEFQKEKSSKESFQADEHRKGASMANNKPRKQATAGKHSTEDIPKLKKEFSKNLFLNLEVVEKPPSKEPVKDQASPVEVEARATSDRTKWQDNGEYYRESVQAIDKKIAEYENKIKKLVDKKKKIKKTYEQLRSILYLEGEELKEAVAIILTKYWSLKLSYMNKEKRIGFKENILIKHNNRIVIVKIKGTHSVTPSHKFITQVWQDLHYSGLGTRADGALIVNFDIGNDPEVRRIPYADEDAEELDDLILIDTRVLHKLTTAIIDGHISVEGAKKILFKKGRAEFNQSSGRASH